MIRPTHVVAAALTALALLPSATVAQRRTVQASVRVADLDLSREAGRQSFDDRLRHAARRACGIPAALVERGDVARCRQEMMADAKVQLAARAAPVRLAQATPQR